VLKVHLNRIIKKVDFRFLNVEIVVYRIVANISKKNKKNKALLLKLVLRLRLFIYLF